MKLLVVFIINSEWKFQTEEPYLDIQNVKNIVEL